MAGKPWPTTSCSTGKSRTTVTWNPMFAKAITYSHSENQLNAVRNCIKNVIIFFSQTYLSFTFIFMFYYFYSLPKSWHSSRCFKKKIIRPIVLTRLIIKSACLYWRLCAFGVIRRPNLTAVNMYVSELIMNAMKIFSCTAEKDCVSFIQTILKCCSYEHFACTWEIMHWKND